MFSRSRLPFIQAMLLSGFLLLFTLPAAAQGDGTDEPPPPPQKPLKGWYPRISGLPYTLTGYDIVVIAGVEYQSRTFQLSFFEGTPDDVMQEDLGRFSVEKMYKGSDGRSYQCTLAEAETLLAAVDAFNDLEEVQAAWLLRSGDPDPNISPTPTGPADATNSAAKYGVESLRPGDVNRDLSWNVMDAVLTLRGIVGLDHLSPFAQAQADVDRSGKPDVNDAVIILHLALGMGLPPPYGYE